jgi:hypothetical protein
MKKIPYGISSYEKIKSDDYYYIDKTKYIETIENYGSTYHFFSGLAGLAKAFSFQCSIIITILKPKISLNSFLVIPTSGKIQPPFAIPFRSCVSTFRW